MRVKKEGIEYLKKECGFEEFNGILFKRLRFMTISLLLEDLPRFLLMFESYWYKDASDFHNESLSIASNIIADRNEFALLIDSLLEKGMIVHD